MERAKGGNRNPTIVLYQPFGVYGEGTVGGRKARSMRRNMKHRRLPAPGSRLAKKRNTSGRGKKNMTASCLKEKLVQEGK